MAFEPKRRRCKNCKVLFTQKKAGQIFHNAKCRTEFHNYGATPIEQLKRRLNAYMRTPEFRNMVREVVRREIIESRERAELEMAELEHA